MGGFLAFPRNDCGPSWEIHFFPRKDNCRLANGRCCKVDQKLLKQADCWNHCTATMSEELVKNTTEILGALINETAEVVAPVLTKLQNVTNEFTYLLFDNQMIHSSIGQSNLSELILILLALFSITVGSYGSISKPNNALPPSDDHPLFDPSDMDASVEENDQEQIPKEYFYTLPIFAGIMLCGLYFFSKKYDIGEVSSYLNRAFTLQIFASVSSLLSFAYTTISRNISYSRGWDVKKLNKRYSLTISNDVDNHPSGLERELMLPDITQREKIIKEEKLLEIRKDISKEDQLMNYYFSSSTIFGYSFGLLFTILYTYHNAHDNWILNNIVGISVVASHLMKLRIPSVKVGTLLLTLFFFYDIYFVFGTDIMLTVATKIKTPSKLLIPRDVSRLNNEIKTTLLGLGDLALPGCFIALCLRFDLFLFHDKNKNEQFHLLNKFNKVYFTTSIVGYVFGLFITFKICSYFKVGQPALLYLCPSVLLSVFTVAYFSGDIEKLWAYDESTENVTTEIDDKKFDVICSKETLFLSGDIADEDIDDENDEDYVDSEVDDNDSDGDDDL